MSRVGQKPVPVPAGVTVNLNGKDLTVEGPKGKLSYSVRPEIDIEIDGDANAVQVTRKNNARESRAYHGLTRALINNMVLGVKDGYEKKLELQGVGYVCSVSGNTLSLRVGLANELKKQIPTGLEVTCPDNTHIDVKGCDKQ
ncbi:MAG: 50S ribosomal protein L6, partial [Pirellulaceae bacterium]